MVGILMAMLMRHELLSRRVGARIEVQLAGRRHGALWRILPAARRA